MEEGKEATALVLLSGGIDSAACVHYYISQGLQVEGVFVDYGQEARDREFSSSSQIASHYGIKLNRLNLEVPHTFAQGEITGRNAFLLLAAILAYPGHRGLISLGIHSGVPYYDCSDSFVKDIRKVLEGYADGGIILDAPFLKWDKRMIVDYCKSNDVPIHLTYSCENGGDIPCGTCLSCRDRKALNVD